MNGTPFAPASIKAASASAAQPEEEEEEDEEDQEESDEEDDDDYDEEEQGSSISSKGFLWGSLAIGAVAVSVAALVAVARRR